MPDVGNRPNIIGEHLKGKRLAAGLSTQDLALRVGVSKSTISRVENGLHLPSVDVLVDIGDALGLDLTELLAKLGARASSELPDFETYLRAKYHLPEEVITRVHVYFREQLEPVRETQQGGFQHD